jgi:outer membrane protein assembly factor BamB
MLHYARIVRLALFALLCCPLAVVAAEKVGWRNDGSGHFPNAEPPTSWSPEENIVWKVDLPARSLASPIVVGDRVFVTANPSDLLCFSASDGRLLWKRSHDYADVFDAEKAKRIQRNHEQAQQIQAQIGELQRQRQEAQQANQEKQQQQLQQQISELEAEVDMLREYPPADDGEPGNTGPTPTSDGHNVYALFGTGVVSSHTLDGQRNWIAYAEPGGTRKTSSPLLIDGKLIVHLEHMIALNAQSGQAIWQADTPERFGSPVCASMGQTPVVVTAAGAIVRASDGQILARDQFNLSHSSPVVQGDTIYALEDGSLKALRLQLGASPNKAVELPVIWEMKSSRTKRLASPVYHEGLLYTVTEQGILEVIDAKTGEREYRKRLDFEGRADPSLCVAGDLIYISSNRGTTLVLRPGREYEEVASNDLADFSSCLCFEGNRIYVRTKKHLWCIEVVPIQEDEQLSANGHAARGS